MPKDRKRKNMLIIACIMLFAILFTLVPSFSFSVTAARRNTGSVAEEYVRYQSRLQNIEKITDLEENGFRLLEDQVFAMPLQKVPEDTPEEAVDEVWFYAALDKQYHRLAVFLADDNGQDGPAGGKLLLSGGTTAAHREACIGIFSGCGQ